MKTDTITDVMRRIYNETNGVLDLELVSYQIDNNGSAILTYKDITGCIQNVDLYPSEASIWTRYKNTNGLRNGFWPVITMETSMEELKEIHRFIWDVVIDARYRPQTPYVNNCVGCEYCRVYGYKYATLSCTDKCPIVWTVKDIYKICGDEFYRWSVTHDSHNAKIVRDIPFKFELEENGDDSCYRSLYSTSHWNIKIEPKSEDLYDGIIGRWAIPKKN